MHILCWDLRHIFVLLRPPGQAAKDLLMQKYIYSERLERSASSGTIFDSKFRLEIFLNYKNVHSGAYLVLPLVCVAKDLQWWLTNT